MTLGILSASNLPDAELLPLDLVDNAQQLLVPG
jgi:hypothetical protein